MTGVLELRTQQSAPNLRTHPGRAPLRRGRVTEGHGSPAAQRREFTYRRSLALADVAATACALWIGMSVLGEDRLGPPALGVLAFVVLVNKVAGAYDRDAQLLRKSTLEEVPWLFQLATLITFLVWMSEDLLVNGEIGQRQAFALWGLLFVGLVLGRRLARACAGAIAPEERCLLVGDQAIADRLCRKIDRSPAVKACLVGWVALERGPSARGALGTLDGLEDTIVGRDVHRVVIATNTQDSDLTLDLVRRVKSLGVKVSVLPRLFEVVGAAARHDDLDGLTLLAVPRFGKSRSSWLMKRTIDITGSALGLIACAPLLGLIAVWIRLHSPGPVLFAQRRIGRDDVTFRMLKFRTMVQGADGRKDELRALNEAYGLFKIAADPRVTGPGRFLRRSSLDELPQLWNVLRGEMSLVGPRPLVGEDDQRVEGWERKRLYLTPGMTGPWQIFGSSKVPLEEMVKIDYLYGANWSLWLDIKILLRTAPQVVGRRGL